MVTPALRPQPIGPSTDTDMLPNTELVMVVEATLVQPLALVSTTEYVPAVVTTIELAVTPVDQTAVPLPVAVSVTDGLAQVKVADDGLTFREGTAVELVTVVEATLVQPLALVNTTEYAPIVVTTIELAVTPVDQRAVPLPTAVSVTDGLAQVKVADEGLMLSEGAAVELVTVVEAKLVHPLALVSVTEYVPVVVAEITDVLSPVDHSTLPAPMADKLAVELAQVKVGFDGEIFKEGGVLCKTVTLYVRVATPS